MFSGDCPSTNSCTTCTEAVIEPVHTCTAIQVYFLRTKWICTYIETISNLPLNLQGLPVLVGLIEDNVAESGKLTGIGVDCIWRLLEVHGTSPLNHLCRLLANAGLPHRLMRAMLTFNQEYQLLLTHAEVGLHSRPIRLCHSLHAHLACLLHHSNQHRKLGAQPAFVNGV